MGIVAINEANTLGKHLEMLDIESGGPGSGRHKTGISDVQKQSVMTLRRAGFKNQHTDAGGNHFMTKLGGDGRVHVMTVGKSSFTHHIQNTSGTRIRQNGTGRHNSLNNYMSTRKF